MKSIWGDTSRIFLAALVITLASNTWAQQPQPDETLPGFRAQSVLEAHGIDNVNLFNGDPGVVIPIGPSYPLGPGYTWQISAHGTSKFWHLDDACSAETEVDNAFIKGQSTLGVGWILDLGRASSGSYDSPDGGGHPSDIGNPDYLQGVTHDNSRLRVTRDATSDQNATQYTVEFPDGIIHTFAHKYSMPTAKSGGCPHSGGGSNCSPDFVDVGYSETAPWYFGLTKIADQFGNTLLTVDYGDDVTGPSWGVAHAYLQGNTSPASTITFNWGTTQVMNSENGNPIWWTVSSIDFATLAGKTLRVTFGYKNSQTGRFTSFSRNSYDNSRNVGICPTPATVAVPFLDTITYSGTAFASFSYAFDYFFETDPLKNKNRDASIDSITLPTGGAITYTYEVVTAPDPVPGHTAGGWCVGLVGSTCDDPETGIASNPSADQPDVGPIHYIQQFLDSSAAIASRTENGNTTYYYRYTQTPVNSNDPNVPLWDEITRRVIVTRPDGNGNNIVTKYLFHVAHYDGSTQEPEDGGIEIERRYYQSSEDGSGDPFRTIINCHTGGTTDGTPICGYRDASGNIQAYFLNTNVRETNHVTWYGVNPQSGAGGTCPATGSATPCAKTAQSSWDSNARAYQTTATTIGHLTNSISRTIFSHWTPTIDSSQWLLDLLDHSSVSDGTTTFDKYFEFNSTTGFLNGVTAWDPTYDIVKVSCYYTNGTGTVDHELSASDGSDFSVVPVPPNTTGYPCATYYPSWPPSSSAEPAFGNNDDAFAKEHTYQNGLPTKDYWMYGYVDAQHQAHITDMAWPSFNATRDSATGFITDDYDTSHLHTAYTYDGLGRLLTITPPGEAATTITYNSTTQTTVSRTGSDGNSTWEQDNYDALGRLSREIKQTGTGAYGFRVHAYDAADHEYFTSEWQSCTSAAGDCLTTAPSHGTTLSNFDPFGRARHIVKADGNSTDVDRTDPNGGTSITYADTYEAVTTHNVGNPGVDSTTSTTKDVLGRVRSVTEPDSGLGTLTTTYTYDPNGKLTGVSNGTAGQARSFTYDAFGFLRVEQTPEGGTVSGPTVTNGSNNFNYIALGSLGNIHQRTEGYGTSSAVTTTTHYDPAVRALSQCTGATTTDCSDGTLYVSNTYDSGCTNGSQIGCGRLYQRVGQNPLLVPQAPVTETYSYNTTTGRLSSLVTGVGNGGLKSTATESWTYNQLGLVKSRTYPGGLLIENLCYTAGLPTTVMTGTNCSAQTGKIAYSATYAPYGGLKAWTATNSVTTTITPDSTLMPRPAEIAAAIGQNTPLWDSGAFSYDGAGNILSIGNGTKGDNFAFTYDVRSRITGATYPGYTTQGFTNDQFGNLTNVSGPNPRSMPQTAAKNNQIQGATYDGRGNMKGYTAGGEVLSWDGLNRQFQDVYSGVAWNYFYNGAGERVVKFPGGNGVTRREMAQYLTEARGESPATGCVTPHFPDVPCSDTDWKWVQKVYLDGITAGCGGGNYCPDVTVSRAGMTVFLLLAENCPLNGTTGSCSYQPPACTSTIFADVPCPGTFTNWINEAYNEGITAGCGGGNFCPSATVSEAQMLIFLYATGETGRNPDHVSSTYRPVPRGSIYTFRDENGHVLTEQTSTMSGSGSGNLVTGRDNVFFGSLLVASDVYSSLSGTPGWSYFHSDHLGTPRIITNPSGGVAESHKYWPYGDEVGCPLAPGQRLNFASMEQDGSCNSVNPSQTHYYDHARTHDFQLGRFVSVDKHRGGPTDPQSWNRYTYARNNALRLVDSNGLFYSVPLVLAPKNLDYIRATYISIVQRPSGKEQFLKNAADPAHNFLQTTDKLNSDTAVAKAKMGSDNRLVGARTTYDIGGVITTRFDPAAANIPHSPVSSNPTTIGAHEMAHQDDAATKSFAVFMSGDDAAPGAPEGRAEQFGESVFSEAPTLSEADAAKIVDAAFAQGEQQTPQKPPCAQSTSDCGPPTY